MVVRGVTSFELDLKQGGQFRRSGYPKNENVTPRRENVSTKDEDYDYLFKVCIQSTDLAIFFLCPLRFY